MPVVSISTTFSTAGIEPRWSLSLASCLASSAMTKREPESDRMNATSSALVLG